jgi:cobalamin biosynthesis protein CbiD
MSQSAEPNDKSRRGFLTGAAAGAASLIAIPPVALAQQVSGSAATVQVSTPQRPGIERVKKGEPALLDVLTQPR